MQAQWLPLLPFGYSQTSDSSLQPGEVPPRVTMLQRGMHMSKTDQNAQVVDFLNYYFKLAAPQYAVMLQAPWGAGKTWFVKEYPESVTSNKAA
jgi:hypothetical protein